MTGRIRLIIASQLLLEPWRSTSSSGLDSRFGVSGDAFSCPMYNPLELSDPLCHPVFECRICRSVSGDAMSKKETGREFDGGYVKKTKYVQEAEERLER